MKKIVFGITSLTLGGAERVLVDLVNELSKNEEYQITILTIYAQGELEKQVSNKVTIKSIYKTSYNELNKIKKKIIIPISILIGKNVIYKKYIKKQYDKEIAFLEGPITRIFSCGKQKNKKIAWIHNDIAQVFGKNIKAKIKRKIDEKIYNKFRKLIFVSKNNLESFNKTYTKNKAEKQIIYNYIDSKKVLERAEQLQEETIEFNTNTINLLVVARLVPQKALDRLIKIHAKLIKEGINHKIYIIGEGPERKKIEELIDLNHCNNTIQLLGKKENPYPYMKKADYICLLSKFEGYGMVLEEAKILNKYILITNTAAKEAVENYSQSKVFENSEEGIYKGLKEILTTEKQKISNNKLYDNTNILNQIKEIL